MVDKKLINNKNNNYCVNKKLIDIGNNNNTNTSNYSSNDDITDNNDESKYIDIIADHISSAILRLKSKELLELSKPITTSNVFNLAEITGLNKLPKLNQHKTEIKQVDYDDSYSEICNNDCNYDCYENCNDNDNHKNKSFHDFDNKKDL